MQLALATPSWSPAEEIHKQALLQKAVAEVGNLYTVDLDLHPLLLSFFTNPDGRPQPFTHSLHI